MAEEMRLQKYLSRAGIASRRKAEELMAEGRVSVNGKTCEELGTKIQAGKDRVEVDGKVVALPQSHVYVLVNKPRGYITSLDDPEDRPIVTDLLPKNMPRIWPAGRLDWDSEGLLLMTDDGELTHALTHPSHHVPKGYAVKVKGKLSNDSPEVVRLREGVEIEDGELTLATQVAVRGFTDKHTWLEFVIEEGKNRQIRRMCEVAQLDVLRLRRIAMGPISIENLKPGETRALRSDEVFALYEAVGLKPTEAAKPSKRQQKREQQDTKRSGTARRAGKPRKK